MRKGPTIYRMNDWRLPVMALLGLSTLLAGCSKKKMGPPPATAVPVVVATAMQKDVPVEVHAIGNVEPYSTVSVKTMVGGELTHVDFTEGQDVKKGERLFVIDPRFYEAALAQAQGNLARDLAQAANARAQAARYAALYKEGVTSREQADQMQTAANALDEVVTADRAAVETAKVNLTYCTIYSPLDGRTGNLMVHRGNVVKANDAALVTINQIQPIYVTFAVSEQHLPEIRRFMATGKLTVRATVPDEPQPAEGTVVFVDNSVDPATATIKLKALFANRDRRLWPGQFADVLLTLTTQPGAIVVPAQAVQTGQKGEYVFVVNADNTAEQRMVKVDRTVGSEAVIASGVQAGEQVVTDGQLRLAPKGTKVETRAASGSSSSNSNGSSGNLRVGGS